MLEYHSVCRLPLRACFDVVVLVDFVRLTVEEWRYVAEVRGTIFLTESRVSVVARICSLRSRRMPLLRMMLLL